MPGHTYSTASKSALSKGQKIGRIDKDTHDHIFSQSKRERTNLSRRGNILMQSLGIHKKIRFQPRLWLGIICAIAVIARILFCLFFMDLQSDYYWEYGEIAKNLYSGKGYSLFYWDGDHYELQFDEAAQPQPSAFMPPGYVVYLLPFLTVENILVRNCLLLFGQIFLGVLCIVITYIFTRRHFSKVSAIISATLIALSPDFIYASVSYTPTIFYHVFVVSILILLYEKRSFLKVRTLIGMALFITITIYFRSEFLLFAVFILISFLIRRTFKPFIVIGSAILLLLLPWHFRNAITFDRTFVPLTTNFGLNFYRGHNPYSIGNWDDRHVEEEIKALGATDSYEIEMSNTYLKHAIKSMSAKPKKETANIFVKIFHLWLFNPDEPRSLSILYIVPNFGILFLFLFGAAKTWSWHKHHYTYLFLIYSTVTAILFFALPRHQAMMKIGMIPFAGVGAEIIRNFFRKRFQKPCHTDFTDKPAHTIRW